MYRGGPVTHKHFLELLKGKAIQFFLSGPESQPLLILTKTTKQNVQTNVLVLFSIKKQQRHTTPTNPQTSNVPLSPAKQLRERRGEAWRAESWTRKSSQQPSKGKSWVLWEAFGKRNKYTQGPTQPKRFETKGNMEK